MARGDSGDFITFLDKLKQVLTLRVLGTSTLSVASVHQLSQLSQRSLSVFVLAVSLITDHAPESPLRLSPNSRSTVAFIRSPRQLLQSDTGVPHFALDPLTYRRLLSLSPAADFAEPRLPRHIPPPPDSGREALWPAAPPPPHFWKGSRPQSSASPACGSP